MRTLKWSAKSRRFVVRRFFSFVASKKKVQILDPIFKSTLSVFRSVTPQRKFVAGSFSPHHIVGICYIHEICRKAKKNGTAPDPQLDCTVWIQTSPKRKTKKRKIKRERKKSHNRCHTINQN